MTFKIVDLTTQKNYSSFDELIFFKEDKNSVIFYSKTSINTIGIFEYLKREDSFNIKYNMKYDIDTKETYIGINNILNDEIIFSVYIEDSICIYSYSKNNRKSSLIHRQKEIDNIFVLDERYYILESNYTYYLFDKNEKKSYFIDEDIFKETFFYGSRKVNFKGKEYLVHSKYMIDSYDLDYYFDYDGIKENTSGIYIIEFKNFINDVKNSKDMTPYVVLTNDKKSYINPVSYDRMLSYNDKYHFISIKSDKSLELYKIEDCILTLEESISFKTDNNIYGLFYTSYPVKIGKFTSYDNYNEYNIFYPDKTKHIWKAEEHGSLYKVLENYIIYYGWDERDASSNYIKIISKSTGKDYITIYGESIILDDNTTILITKK